MKISFANNARSFILSTSSGLVGLAGVIALLGASLFNEYQEANKHAQIEAENLSRVLEEHTQAIVQKVNLVLFDVPNHTRPSDMRLPHSASTPRAKKLHAFLKSHQNNVPEVSVFHVANANGDYVFSSLDPPPLINITDREYFQRQKNSPAAGLVISRPLVSRTTGKWSLVLSRRLDFENGDFAGITLAVLDMEYFQRLYRSLDLNTHGLVALYDKDLYLAARYPLSEGHVGQKVPLSVAPYLDKGVRHGVYHAKSGVDGIDRLFSFRQVGDLPLVVFAGIAEDDYLAVWRLHVWQYGTGVLVLSLVVISLWRQQRHAEASLRIAAAAFDSQEGMMVTDANSVIQRVNRAFTKTSGYSAEEVVGLTPRLFKSGRHDTGFYTAMWDSIKRNGYWQGEIWNKRKNGEIYPKWMTVTAVKDENDVVTHYVETNTDITERKMAEEQINNLAFYDSLTQLPNRRLLMDRLRHTLTSRGRTARQGALLFIDLDNFKSINDTRGHDIGDLLLVDVAGRLQACVREGDTVARLGGDEFVVMLEGLSGKAEQAAAQSELVAEKILASISQPYDLQGQTYHTTASIGISLFRGREVSLDELLKRADAAMYQAKQSGRNTLRFFDPAMQAALEVRVALESDLRGALSQQQYKLYYQMQIDHAGHIIGAEVLLRWVHPQRGLVLPLQFIPLAEETGLILSIGHWVLETACKQIKSWEADTRTRDLQLAVNVSARQFRQPDFVAQVTKVLEQTAINPKRLKLELTESLVLDDITDTVTKMQALKQIGVRFSMDDFGTGYSSLSYLTQLPLDQVKIDQSFVRNIGTKTSDAVIVQTIVGMATNLGMEVIAEGVETQAQRNFLEDVGCMLYQGYLFGKPVPLEEFTASLI